MVNFTSQFQNLWKKIKASILQLQQRLAQNLNSTQGQKEISPPSVNLSNTPLKEKVKAELLEAWSFMQTVLFPTLLSFVVMVVEKIDPPLSVAATKVTSNPTVIDTWQKLQATSLWKKATISLAPIGRSLSTTLQPVTTSESIKPILAKPLGAVAFGLGLTLLLSLKPHPAVSASSKQISNQANQVVTLPAERGDAPISPEKILITSIQAQVVDISKSYGEALIASVQTNFKLGRLIVQLSDAWYKLNPQLQEQLVADLEKRSQTLTFKKLFLLDTEQHLLARTSAIAAANGTTNMIILRR